MNSEKGIIIKELKNTTFIHNKNKKIKKNKENLIKIFLILFHLCFVIYVAVFNKNINKEKSEKIVKKNPVYIPMSHWQQMELELEEKMPHLKEINKKRIFEKKITFKKSH